MVCLNIQIIPKRSPRFLLLIGACAIYGLGCLISIYFNILHYVWIVVGLQFAVLLPALLYSLRGSGGVGMQAGVCWRVGAWICVITFLLLTSLVNYRVSRGITLSDESAYRFQARILAAGKLDADTPPGAADDNRQNPVPLRYLHEVVSPSGWYAKYPLGWPLVLALPERWHLEWAVNPLLVALILVILGVIAREVFGKASVFPAVWMAALSPSFIANSVGLLSHALCGVLIAAACLFCLQGIRARKVSRFALMFLLLVLSFHVRPYTALLCSAVLGTSSLLFVRRDVRTLLLVAWMSVVAGLAAAGSVLLYNWAFTGNVLLSPYALSRGLRVPAEVGIDPLGVLKNLATVSRHSFESMLMYSFPFVLLLAAYGFWTGRKNSPAAWMLPALLPALIVGHLVQTENSGSAVGERYWFEGYFAVAALAARGLLLLLERWRSPAPIVVSAVCALTVVQLAMSAMALSGIDARSRPSREVREVAERYRGRDCVVFLADGAPLYYASHMNLNRPDWKSDSVFYLVDPGNDRRPDWARLFGRNAWAVVTYDPQIRAAQAEFYREGVRVE